MTIVWKPFIVALTLVFPLVSCQSQGPLSATPPRPVTVQITVSSRATFAQQGDFRVAAFDAPNTTFKVGAGATVETTFKAIFSDAEGVGISKLPVRVGLRTDGEPEMIFGSVSAPATTNETGEITIRFNSGGKFGRVNVFVETELPGMSEPVDSSLYLNIERLTNDIGSLTVLAFSNFYHPIPDTIVVSIIRAQVKDANNVGMPNIVVNIVTDMGSISHVTQTDSTGVATAEWRNDYEEGTAHISVSIPGTPFEATTQIVVMIDDFDGGRLEISTDRSEIFADGGLTTARIRALLKDGDNQALAGKWLIFTSTHGAISSPIETNAYGYVDTIFTDVGIPSYDPNGNVVPAKIYVKYPPLNLIDSCEVTISPRNPVNQISLTTSKNQMVAVSGDTATIRATAMLADGAFATPGTLVQFEVTGAGGYFLSAGGSCCRVRRR